MQSLLDREAATEQTFQFKEHRRALRQTARRVSLALHAQDGDAYLAGTTLQDLSRTGMRVRSETSLPCGQRILVHAPEDAGLTPVSARIMRVNLVALPTGDCYEFGIHIIDEQRKIGNLWYLHFHYGGERDHSVPEA